MICFPNCKINVGLYVTNKRADGYHDLETVFFPVMKATTIIAGELQPAPVLNDVLEIIPAMGEATMHMSGLAVAGNMTDNLVWKAYDLLKNDFGKEIGAVDIYLHKVITMGAGLGGGSADGAYMLQLLNDYHSLGLTQDRLAAYALQLGSDCPFFIYNTPRFATGRGEVMQPVDLKLEDYELRINCPGVHVSTAKAFAGIQPRPAAFDLRQISDLPVTEWKHYISNDFERPVFAAFPELAIIKETFYEQGAVYASLTGTGSAVYGLFEKSK